ncbi:uncharacterized protein LOC118994528 [Sturnira hondurensis]|uniref:uncharacterized protein LOC118994528 n=1 Tax=Sturnira hondurensis TaxID=192404 RepID=UPI00187A7601|nr:uncharacterized protein LOC118994528 [Sturnira hondurensis]
MMKSHAAPPTCAQVMNHPFIRHVHTVYAACSLSLGSHLGYQINCSGITALMSKLPSEQPNAMAQCSHRSPHFIRRVGLVPPSHLTSTKKEPKSSQLRFTSQEPVSSRPVPRSDCSALPESFRHRSPPPTRKRAALPAGGRAPELRRSRLPSDTWSLSWVVAELPQWSFFLLMLTGNVGGLSAFELYEFCQWDSKDPSYIFPTPPAVSIATMTEIEKPILKLNLKEPGIAETLLKKNEVARILFLISILTRKLQ